MPEALRHEAAWRRPQLLRHEPQDRDLAVQSRAHKRLHDGHLELREPAAAVRRAHA